MNRALVTVAAAWMGSQVAGCTVGDPEATEGPRERIVSLVAFQDRREPRSLG